MQTDELAIRKRVIEGARTVVVKVGTNVLSRDDDTLDDARLDALARQLHAIRQTGRRVVPSGSSRRVQQS